MNDHYKVVVDAICQDPINYSDVVLGRPVAEYVSWILKDSSWGGAIELSIFSLVFKLEIVSIDVSTGRADIFGEGNGYSKRAFVMYSGSL